MKKILLVVIAFSVSGCGVNKAYYPMNDIKLSPKSASSEVEILTERPSRKYVALGGIVLGGRARHNHQMLINKAQKEAAKLGADFIWIINTDTEYRNYVAPGHGSFSGQGYGQGNWNASGSYIGPSAGTLALPILRTIAGIYTPSKTGINFDEKILKDNPEKFVISRFDLNSKAEEAGLSVGDQVIGLHGLDMSDRRRIRKLDLQGKAGQKTKVTVLHDGKKMEFEVERVEN